MSLEMENGATAPDAASARAARPAGSKPAWLYKAFVMLGVFSGNLVLTAFIYDFYSVPLNGASSYVVTVGWIVPWLIIYAVHPRENRQWLLVIVGLTAFVLADQVVWAVSHGLLAWSFPTAGMVTTVMIHLATAVLILGPVIVAFVRMLRREGLLPGQPS